MHSTERDSARPVMGSLARLILALHVTLYQPLRSVGVLWVHQALANCAGQCRSCKERKGRRLKAAGKSPHIRAARRHRGKAATHGRSTVPSVTGPLARATAATPPCAISYAGFNAEEELSWRYCLTC